MCGFRSRPVSLYDENSGDDFLPFWKAAEMAGIMKDSASHADAAIGEKELTPINGQRVYVPIVDR